MTAPNLKEILLEELDYTEGSGLEDAAMLRGRPIPFVDQVYFIQDIPVAYFSQLRNYSNEELQTLHRQVWSQSRVPLLYVISPTEIRVYNGYAEPAKTVTELNTDDRLLQSLQQLLDVETARQQIRDQLDDYKRLSLETGAFWSTLDGQRIKRDNRADKRLLRSMDQVRRHLSDLPNDQAYALLGRSLFVRYLEDRGILTPEWIWEATSGQAENYLEALKRPTKQTTNLLFEALNRRFHGDLFPLDREHEKVEKGHLDLIRQFLEGYDFDSGQLSFWPYDFTYIPIELISGIYDTFLCSEQNLESNEANDDDDETASRERRRRTLGAYYTPIALVDFVIEETLPLEVAKPEMTILDPTCGSGVFLVRAYQRLVEAWLQQYDEPLTAKVLSKILKENIFGVDIERNAIQIAAFSLYLALLDFLTNEEIDEEDFEFPSLEKTNLLALDFFSKELDKLYSEKRFDRILGNLPWGRGTLTPEASRWIADNEQEVGGRQIAQAFLRRVPQFCAENGEVALLAGAKSTILVASNTYERFRQQFFETYRVRAVVNFAALVYELFDEAISPAVALFYQPLSPISGSKIVYGVPKPSALSQRLGTIVLDTTEVKYLEREELLEYPVLWKVALWGTPRDAALIRRLRTFPKLQDLENQESLGWRLSEGYVEEQKGSENYDAPWLQGKPFLDVRKFKPYIVETHGTVQKARFHRPRTPAIYEGPIVLIRRSKCEAAYLDSGSIAYHNKITGIAGKSGQEPILKWLAAYINSPLAKYYHFLTSTSWGVERGTIIHDEYRDMPFLIPDEDDPRFLEVIDHFDQITLLLTQSNEAIMKDVKAAIQKHEAAIAERVFEIYEIAPAQRQLVQDMVEYGIGFFNWSKKRTRTIKDASRSHKSYAVQPPETQMLVAYANTFMETVTSLLHYQGQRLNAIVYQNGAPLSVVGFELDDLANAKPVQITNNSFRVREILHKLDHLLLEQQTPTLYTRRHVRIYDGSWLYLVRPSERRFWTRSLASADADSFIAALLNQSKVEMLGTFN